MTSNMSKESRQRKELVIAFSLSAVFNLIGIGLLVTAYSLYTSTVSFLEGATSTVGAVVALQPLEEEGASVGGRQLVPVVRYTAADGREMEFQADVWVRFEEFAVGQKVPVVYRPDGPSDARIDSPWQHWFGVAMFCIVGLAAILIPDVTLLRIRAGQRQRTA